MCKHGDLSCDCYYDGSPTWPAVTCGVNLEEALRQKMQLETNKRAAIFAPGVYDEEAILSSMWDVDWSDYIARCEQLQQSIASELQN